MYASKLSQSRLAAAADVIRRQCHRLALPNIMPRIKEGAVIVPTKYFRREICRIIRVRVTLDLLLPPLSLPGIPPLHVSQDII